MEKQLVLRKEDIFRGYGWINDALGALFKCCFKLETLSFVIL